MIGMKEALRAYLLADESVAGLVSADPERISWAARPRGRPLPSIALHQVSGLSDYAMLAPTGLVTTRVQVDCWAGTNKDATIVARAVKRSISGLRTVFAGVQFQGCFLESEIDFVDDAGPPPAEILFRVSQDFIIWHDE